MDICDVYSFLCIVAELTRTLSWPQHHCSRASVQSYLCMLYLYVRLYMYTFIVIESVQFSISTTLCTLTYSVYRKRKCFISVNHLHITVYPLPVCGALCSLPPLTHAWPLSLYISFLFPPTRHFHLHRICLLTKARLNLL